MLLWVFLLACGSDSNGSEGARKIDPGLIVQPKDPDSGAVDTQGSQQIEAMNRDADCLIQYVRDIKTAQTVNPKWEQPSLEIYEGDDCKSQLVVH